MADFDLTASWTDANDYSYTTSITSAIPSVSVDVASAPPGSAIVTVEYKFKGTAINTTTGHDAPRPEQFIEPVWANGSPACDVDGLDVISNNKDGSTDPSGPCAITQTFPVAPSLDPNVSKLPSGKVFTLTTTFSSSLEVPEGQADSLARTFEKPDGYVLATSGISPAPSLCLLASGGFYVTATTGGIGCL